MNIDQRALGSQSPTTHVQNRYQKPCLSWTGSAKSKFSGILDKNLEKVANLKASMQGLPTLAPLRVSLSLKHLDEVHLPKIVEVDESLPDDELYPKIKSPLPARSSISNDGFVVRAFVQKTGLLKKSQTFSDFKELAEMAECFSSTEKKFGMTNLDEDSGSDSDGENFC